MFVVVCHAISVNCRCGVHECAGDIINIFNERSEKKRAGIPLVLGSFKQCAADTPWESGSKGYADLG